MTALISVFCGPMSTQGSSSTAQFVVEQANQGQRHLQESISLGMGGKGVFEELCTVAEECSVENWDGYGAEAVKQETYSQTYRFLEALPLGTKPPSVGVESDGHLTLEWYKNPDQVLSISVSPEGILHYAARLGGSKRSGTEPFLGDIHEDILRIICRVSAA